MFPWLPFLSFILIVAFTPGPIKILSMNIAASAGLRKALIFNLGNYIGIFIVLILCMAFSSLLYSVIPKIQPAMKIIGALYMVYLVIITMLLIVEKQYTA